MIKMSVVNDYVDIINATVEIYSRLTGELIDDEYYSISKRFHSRRDLDTALAFCMSEFIELQENFLADTSINASIQSEICSRCIAFLSAKRDFDCYCSHDKLDKIDVSVDNYTAHVYITLHI